jgi:hypothetical protein
MHHEPITSTYTTNKDPSPLQPLQKRDVAAIAWIKTTGICCDIEVPAVTTVRMANCDSLMASCSVLHSAKNLCQHKLTGCSQFPLLAQEISTFTHRAHNVKLLVRAHHQQTSSQTATAT